MRTRVAAALLFCLTALAPQAAQAQDDERRALLAVVQRLFDAMRTRDSAAIRSVFDPAGRLVSIRMRQGQPVVAVTPWEQFAAANARDTARVWDERSYDPEVRIDATLATVWVAYDFYAGATFSHCGYDAFHLLKTAAGWKIMEVADTFQRENCPRR
jgi:hypothetical protein